MKTAINYEITGAGRPFVFQHGLGSNISQVQRLLGGDFFEGIQWISSDSRGHGKTPFDPNNLPSFGSYADDVMALLASLKIEKALFGGISMGAGISLNIALRCPDLVEGLVLIRPAWLNQILPHNLSILGEAADYLEQENGKEKFGASPSFQKIQSVLPMAAKSIMGLFERDQVEHTAYVLNNMLMDCPFENLEDLSNIQKPTLIIGNDADPLHPFSMAEKIHEYIPNSTLLRVPSRYIDDWQHKKAVVKAIDEFLINL